MAGSNNGVEAADPSVLRVLQLSGGGLARPEIRAGARLTQDLWKLAHGLHQEHTRLHHSGVHGFGIAAGLQVTATQEASRFVTIHPGLAVDRSGRPVVVTENERDRALRLFNMDVPIEGRTWIYLLLDYRDDLTENSSDPTNNYFHVLEYAYCEASLEPARADQIELARVMLEPGSAPVTNARDPSRPGINEIDLRFRDVLPVGLHGEVVIGQVYHEQPQGQSGWGRARAGLALLTRFLQREADFQSRFLPLVRVNGDEAGCTLLYLTGVPPNLTEQRAQLARFIEQGGTVLAESPAPGFDAAIRQLAPQLGVQLQPVAQNHPLLTAHYVFSGPPEGASNQGGVLAGPGPNGRGALVLSLQDYGSAWEGGGGLPRGRIRDAVEFGVNLAAYAAQVRTQAGLEVVAPPASGVY